MFRYYLLSLLACILFIGCRSHPNAAVTSDGPLHQIDSIIDVGGNPFDVASYLHEHMETLDLNLDFSRGNGYSVMTSADGDLRVYSVYDWPSLLFPQIKIIFNYRDGENDDDIQMKEIGDVYQISA